MRRAIVTAFMVGVLVCGVAACGSSSKPKTSVSGQDATNTTVTTGSTSGAASTADACALVTKDDASGLFGYSAESKELSGGSAEAGEVSKCGWGYETNAGQAGNVIYLLQVRVYDKTAFYGRETYGAKGEDLSGIGDRAFYGSFQPRAVVVQFVKGSTVVAVAYSINGVAAPDAPLPTAQKDKLVALAKQAAGRL